MAKQVVRISGPRVTTIYTERIDLRALGKLTVARASNVEWDEREQGWVAVLADGTRLPGVYTRREDAIAAEIEALNAHLHGPNPPEVIAFEGKESHVLFDPV